MEWSSLGDGGVRQLVVESRKTEREWKETVTRMVGHGASLTAQEQEVLIKYAAEYFGAE